MKVLLTSKLAWSFAIVHVTFFSIGMYQRNDQFHFIYEPLILQIIIFVDVVWLFLADLLHIGSLQQPNPTLMFMGVLGTFQWFLTGYWLSKLTKQKDLTDAVDRDIGSSESDKTASDSDRVSLL